MIVEDRLGGRSNQNAETGSLILARQIARTAIGIVGANEGLLAKTLTVLTSVAGEECTGMFIRSALQVPESRPIPTHIGATSHRLSLSGVHEATVGLIEIYFRLPDKNRPAFLDGLARQRKIMTP